MNGLPGRPAGLLAVTALILTLVGCAQLGTDPAPEPGEEAAAEALESPAERWRQALQLLGEGDEDMAEAELVLLRETERYASRASHLIKQIRTPIQQYFPQEHFNVELRPGQSLSSLSRQYLGDVLAFYALARYNGIAQPAHVSAGQMIRIPMTDRARRVRTEEAGEADADDPVDDSTGMPPTGGPAPVSTPQIDAAADNAAGENELTPEQQERVRRDYRRATTAFQRQNLDATIRYCDRVLDLVPDHENCTSYRERARALQRQLNEINEDEPGG